MDEVLLKKAEALVDQCTAHTWDASGLTGDWVMAQTDENGYPNASMITCARADGFQWLAFCTGVHANKPQRAAQDSRTCVYLFERQSFTGISLTGIVDIITDITVKRQMWYDALANHFTGPEDEGMCVLMFKPERYNILIDYHNISGVFMVE